MMGYLNAILETYPPDVEKNHIEDEKKIGTDEIYNLLISGVKNAWETNSVIFDPESLYSGIY